MEETQKTRDNDRTTLLEAALYAAGRPLELEELARIVDTRSNGVIHKLISALKQRFDLEGSALEIKELPDARYVLQLRSQFTDRVRKLANRPLLSKGPLKTLSYIAYYQPVEQARVVEDRGKHIYTQLRLLEETGLITRERESGKAIVLRTTPYFADYFGFSHNPGSLKTQLRRFFEELKIHKLEDLKEHGLNGFSVPEIITDEKNPLDIKDAWEKPLDKALVLPDNDK